MYDSAPRVLVIEDELHLRQLLVRLLDATGHAVHAAQTGQEGIEAASAELFDLVLLDLMLPDVSGEHVLHDIVRECPQTKVMVLSAVSEVGRRVGVMDDGAVDFVAKPFVNSELLARVRARLRDGAASPSLQARLQVGPGMQFDLCRHELLAHGQRVPLSQREALLLLHLLQHRGQVCTRAELLADVWGLEFDPGTNIVDVCIARLRGKLLSRSIETVRHGGYRLAAI